ncbi:MAG: hypothetical protein A2868_01810 [Candidatus Levybacteria bacterium RIFCSPHIGHO2_01_FULL_40_15b]|nr:MAG: hypothetical protein A2868_01810 [Candidatus Levybacteria bacterium RIFCSPHIGHO2_01_FULL_40_15b]
MQSVEQTIKQKITDQNTNPLTIESMRTRKYDGSDLKIERELSPGENYRIYVASYISDGLKIYGLLTIPNEAPPNDGSPAIIFNHGYISPEEYRSDERYKTYVDGFAKNGYVVFKPDYRGHGNSEGRPEGAYFSPAYTVDVLNALASVKKLKDVDPDRIGMWGHSLGGSIVLRSMVINPDIKAGVIWSGAVGTYQELYDEWWSKRIRPTWTPSERERQANRPTRQSFIEKFGVPSDSDEFWKSISPNFYLEDISGSIQLHHGTADETVPYVLSEKLYNRLKTAGKEVEYYTYEGADHNLSSPAFELAIERSIEFFDKHLK